MSPPDWIGQSLLLERGYLLLEETAPASDDPAMLTRGLKLAQLLRDHDYHEDLVCSALILEVYQSGLRWRRSLERVFGQGIVSPVLAAADCSADLSFSDRIAARQEAMVVGAWRALVVGLGDDLLLARAMIKDKQGDEYLLTRITADIDFFLPRTTIFASQLSACQEQLAALSA